MKVPVFGAEPTLSNDICQLVNRCLAGEHLAMVELVERYRRQVFGLCYRMLGQTQDAEDMTQETFFRVLKSLARWDQNRDFEPWLLAIAGNRCRTLLATRMRKPPPQLLVDNVPDECSDMQAANQLAEEVNLGLQQLRDEYRQAFVLFHENELSYAEIAEAMECPLGTVKTWVHRARRELIDHLRKRGVVEESGHEMRSL